MKYKHILFLITANLVFCLPAFAQKITTKTVTTSRTVVNGKVIENTKTSDSTEVQIKTKTISRVIPFAQYGIISINSDYRKINVLPAKDDKFKIETNAYYTGNVNLSDDAWFDRLNITSQGIGEVININAGPLDSRFNTNNTSDGSVIVPFVNRPSAGRLTTSNGQNPVTKDQLDALRKQAVELEKNKILLEKNLSVFKNDINSAHSIIIQNDSVISAAFSTINGRGFTTITGGGNPGLRQQVYETVAVYGENGEVVMLKSDLKRIITLYVPQGAQLNIETKYGDVLISQDISDVTVKLSNASLDMQNADKANIECTYGNVRTRNIKNLILNLKGGKLYGKNFEKADFTTSYSQIEAGDINKLTLNSTSDDYDLESINKISAIKNYGSLRIDKLTGSLSLVGRSADVRIKTIDPQVRDINIDNKYADLRLPFTNLPNYSLSFTGNYSNIYAPFTLLAAPVPTLKNDQTKDVSPGNSGPQNNFAITQGNVNGPHTAFIIKCLSCSLDFK